MTDCYQVADRVVALITQMLFYCSQQQLLLLFPPGTLRQPNTLLGGVMQHLNKYINNLAIVSKCLDCIYQLLLNLKTDPVVYPQVTHFLLQEQHLDRVVASIDTTEARCYSLDNRLLDLADLLDFS